MCRMVVVVVLLLSLGVSNPVRAIGTRGVIPNRLQQQRLAVCGEDARAGLILHQAYDPDDALADPSLALLNPINGVSRPVNVPEPSNSFSAQFACVAFVKTAVGAYYLLDGSTGDAYPLDFMDSAEEWKYVDSAHWDSVGERRYALFATTGIKGIRAFMMDLSKGLSWDLTPLITEEGSMRGSHFSPSGKYLTMTAGELMDARTWLLPRMIRPRLVR